MAGSRITIITINYNNEFGLKRTMDSVYSFGSDIFEYVIVDGGSNDGSYRVIEEYKQRSFTFGLKVLAESDRGISDAFNKGVALASGDWILLLNSGDELSSSYLTLMHMKLEKSEYQVLYGDVLMDTGILIKGDKYYSCKIPYVMPRLNHPTCLIHKSVYKQIGKYDLSLKIAMDYDFLKRASKEYKFGYVEGAYNIMESTGISNKLTAEMRSEVLSLSSNKCISRLLFMYNDIMRC